MFENSAVIHSHGARVTFDNVHLSLVGNSGSESSTIVAVLKFNIYNSDINVINNTASNNSRLLVVSQSIHTSDERYNSFKSIAQTLLLPTRKEERSANNISRDEIAPVAAYDGNGNRSEYIILHGSIIHVQVFILPIFFNPKILSIKLVFKNNTMREKSVGFICIGCINNISIGNLVFMENECLEFSYLIVFNNTMRNGSIYLVNNHIEKKSVLLSSRGGKLIMTEDSGFTIENNIANNAFSVMLFSSNITFDGQVSVRNNSISHFAVFNFFNSEIRFLGSLVVVNNSAQSGGLNFDKSMLTFIGESSFYDNRGINGGAITLISSLMMVLATTRVEFMRNKAKQFGGAICILKPKQSYVCDALQITTASCSIQVFDNESKNNCQHFNITFSENEAGVAGNAIYGGRTGACMPSDDDTFCSDCSFPETNHLYTYHGMNDSSDLSSFSSDPTRVCFCDNGIPDCYKIKTSVTVNPGEYYNLSLAVVGYGLGTVPGTIVARNTTQDSVGESLFRNPLVYNSQTISGREYKELSYVIISKAVQEEFSLGVSAHSFVKSLDEVKAILEFQQTKQIDQIYPVLQSPYDSVFEIFYHIPIFVEVNLIPCPMGFELIEGKCVCHQLLRDNSINLCSIINGTGIILRPTSYWIGLFNETNSSILLHPYCPFDYCRSEEIYITVESPDSQCQYERSGFLCGSCSRGLSMILGSSQCRKCSHVYLMSISTFILVGIALVTLITTLNVTVSVGSMNGIIFFANILQANQIFMQSTSTATAHGIIYGILFTFIYWMNLDLGIPMCLYDGMTTYTKTWLQFVFPLYILGIVGAIIVASRYSSRITRLFGKNSVSVLATLVLLSYTKILRILITALSFTTITAANGNHTTVWLADGNVKYFELKHAVLFTVSLLVLILFGVPYTVTLYYYYYFGSTALQK